MAILFPGHSRVDARRTIEVARVLCIFFMMYTHIEATYTAAVAVGPAWLDSAVHFFRDDLGRAAVPLLSSISGWLFAATFRGTVWSNAVRKARTLLVPMVIWNLLAVAFWLAIALVFTRHWPEFDTTVMGWLNSLLGVNGVPRNPPTYFLRDLFVSTLFGAALLVPAPSRRTIWVVTVLLIILIVAVPITPLLRRPAILMQFMIGIAMQRSSDIMTLRSTGRIALFGLALLAVSAFVPVAHERLDDAVFRLAMAALAWTSAVLLARSRIATPIVRISPAIFFVFCSHMFVIWIVDRATLLLTEAHAPGRFIAPATYFAEPLVALAIGVALFGLLQRLAPGTLAILTGNRARGAGA